MHESELYQYWGGEAARQATRERALEDILQVLEIRLQPEAAQRFKPNLERIEDLQHLSQLLRAAALANSPDDFRKVLDANRN